MRGEVFSLHHVVMVGICYRVMRKNLLTFEQQWTDEACGRTPPKFVTDELPPPARTASSQLSVGRPRADTVTPLPPPALDVDPTSLKSTCAAICAPRRLHSFK